MKFINKLERKFGRYAIPNLMKYVIVFYAIGFIIGVTSPQLYYEYLSLDINMVLRGQIWRLVTFIMQPMDNNQILFVLIELYFYYWVGNSLENVWGAFRFNLYYFSGILFNILAAFIVYFINRIDPTTQILGGYGYYVDVYYINRSMFFAFAAIYPNVQVLLMYLIPVKVKWLAIFYGAFIAYLVVPTLLKGDLISILYVALPIIVAFINFFLFFFATRNMQRLSPNEIKRKSEFKRKMREAKKSGNVVEFRGRQVVTRHKCAICGRTELDDEDLEFRFCSKCDGNYEYCMDHLFTHEHVIKEEE